MSDSEKQGIHFPLLIGAPKNIPYTVEAFDHISCMGISNLLCNYKIFFCEREDHIEMYMADYLINTFINTKRFENIKFWEYESVEMVLCRIPKTHQLNTTIEKYFSHLIMR